MRARLLVPLLLLATACSDPSDPGNDHRGQLTHDATWTRAGSPHVVHGSFSIWGGATLTIEAGATVLFDSAAGIAVGQPAGPGILRVLGTAEDPVVMKSLDSAAGPGAWFGLLLHSSTTSELHHVTLEGCGTPHYLNVPPACVVLGDPQKPTENPELLIDHVTLAQGRGTGLILYNQSRFAAGSTALSVLGMSADAARFRTREAARFPLGGTISGNDTNEVRLEADTLRDSLTLAAGVPWGIVGTLVVEGPKTPVLVIAAGNTIRLSASIEVGASAPGGLQVGSPGGPRTVLLPRADWWQRLGFYAHAVSSGIWNTTLDHCGLVSTCVLIAGSFGGDPAPAPVLADVRIQNSGGSGLGLANAGAPGPGSANLTITGSSNWPIELSLSPVAAIPPGQYTGNIFDRVRILQAEVRQDETWPALGVPYYVYNHIVVGDSVSHPTLTLLPGTTIYFEGAGTLSAGMPRPGAIHAVGTAQAPITFTATSGLPGGWTGIVLGPAADSATIFDHVVVDNGGAEYPVAGSFHFYVDLGSVIQHSSIQNSSGCGVLVVNQPPWTTDFTAPALGNSFSNNAGGDICGP